MTQVLLCDSVSPCQGTEAACDSPVSLEGPPSTPVAPFLLQLHGPPHSAELQQPPGPWVPSALIILRPRADP